MCDLVGVRVLITRPAEQVAAWQACLCDAGASTYVIPFMRIEPLVTAVDTEVIKQVIMNLDAYQIAIFVSQNAVRHGLEWIDQYWPQLPTGIDYLAIGKATANALAQHQICVQADTQAMNSEALLAVSQLQSVSQKKIVIFRGKGGRPYLGEQLLQRGAQVDYCELYRRQLPVESCAQLQESDFGKGKSHDIITVHSGEILGNLVHALEQKSLGHLRFLPLVVPSIRVADMARISGFDRIIIAENATDNAMLTALKNWCKES